MGGRWQFSYRLTVVDGYGSRSEHRGPAATLETGNCVSLCREVATASQGGDPASVLDPDIQDKNMKKKNLDSTFSFSLFIQPVFL